VVTAGSELVLGPRLVDAQERGSGWAKPTYRVRHEYQTRNSAGASHQRTLVV